MDQRIFKGNFGLERETLRVDSRGRLAQTPHPFGENEHITRDFCENQIELITPVCSSIKEVMAELERLDKTARDELKRQNESIWLYSNPPSFKDENEIPVANFTGEQSSKRLYREQLERRYGKRLMLFSGIHFNFSFSDEYLKRIYIGNDLAGFKDSFYLKLYKQISVHSWLPLLLTAASPYYDKSMDKDGESGISESRYASIRSGERGYWNEFEPILEFGSVLKFVNSIRQYVNKGVIWSASELYLPVRLKPKGENTLESFRNGISHIELRMFDLNPLEPLGISENDLKFTHLLLVYLSSKPDFELTPELQKAAIRNHKKASLADLEGIKINNVPILQKAKKIISDMKAHFRDTEYLPILEYEESKLENRLCKNIDPHKIYG